MIHDEATLFGRGIHFPPRIGADGRLAWSSGSENIRQSIRLILLTEPNERIMMPEFGGGLKRYLFRPNTAATHRLIEEAISRSLGLWERRIDTQSVNVQADANDPNAALVTIRYKLIAMQTDDELQLRLELGAPNQT